MARHVHFHEHDGEQHAHEHDHEPVVHRDPGGVSISPADLHPHSSLTSPARRWIAIWTADRQVHRARMMTEGREAIERAAREGRSSVLLGDGDDAVTLSRHQFFLPVFIESPDWEDARGFMDALEARVFERALD